MHFVVFFLLGDSPTSELNVPMFRKTVRSISIGGVCRKNDWDEIARVFIQVQDWLNIASVNQKEREAKGVFYLAVTLDLP